VSSTNPAVITNALSVDVEEYYHAEIFRRATHGGSHPLESRVERTVDVLLALLREHAARATFFVLGEVAARLPGMLRRIALDNHEIACHGDRHDNVWSQSPGEFGADLRRAKSRIEEAVGERVIGYRAPNFSIRRAQQRWAYQILVEEGFSYDSSVFPILHDRYGQPDAPRFPYQVWSDHRGELMEFPIGTVRVMGVNLPIGGGGYFRLLPLAFTTLGLHHLNTRQQRPAMFYLHPWELDAEQPRLPMAWHHRARHYGGIEKNLAKLSQLLSRFCFAPAREVLQLAQEPAARRVTTLAPQS
jgi:polysaccharide deacetylase family protein (PEP-CTERM system associated)